MAQLDSGQESSSTAKVHRAQRHPSRAHRRARTTKGARARIEQTGAATPQEDRLLPVAQAADRLGTPERFVRRLIAERRIEFVKFGEARCSPVRIRESVLDAFIAASTVRPPE